MTDNHNALPAPQWGAVSALAVRTGSAMSDASCIAILEDDEFLRDALDNLARSAGYDVLKFESADDFLVRASTRRIDVIVTDLHMPGIDGLELIQKLKAAGDRTPAIVMTANPDMRVEDRVLAVGASFLNKPFDADVLIKMIERAIADRIKGSNGSG